MPIDTQQETNMLVVIKTVNDQLTAHIEYSEDVTHNVIDWIECSSRQEAGEVQSLWNTYRYMNKVVSLKDALSQVREPNYPGHNEVEAEYTRNVARKAAQWGNETDPPYQQP